MGIFSLFSDIFKETGMEENIKKLEALLEEEKEKTKQLQKQLEEESLLSAILFHDMKSPIATVKMNIEALHDILKEADLPGAGEIVELVEDQIDEMGELVAQMLALSRIEDGVLSPDSHQVELKSYLQELAETVKKGVEQNGMSLSLNLDDAPEKACFDPVLMRRVLSNLVTNAVSHSVDSTEVGLVARKVSEGNEEWLELEVWDHGVGIAPDIREKIFEKYFSLDEGGHAKRTSGLGLYFCKVIAEKSGGSIRVEPFCKESENSSGRKDTGSRFILKLPACL